MKPEIRFNIGGVDYPPPVNWVDIKIACFGDDFIAPQIEIDEFEFVNEVCKFIVDWMGVDRAPNDPRVSSVFDGIPFTMQLSDSQIGILTYEGMLDTTTVRVKDYDPVSKTINRITCKIRPYLSLDLASEQLESVTFGLLAFNSDVAKRILSNTDYTDVPVVVRKKFDATETALVSVSLMVIQREIRELLDKNIVMNTYSILFGLTAPTNKPAELFRMIVVRLVMIAYAAFILIALINMIKTVVNNLVPKPTKYKGIRLRKAIEKAYEYFNMNFKSDIRELDQIVYLPSKNDDKIRKNRNAPGIPSVGDYGYSLADMVGLAKDLFNAELTMDYEQVGNQYKRVVRLVPVKELKDPKNENYKLVNDSFGDQGILLPSFRFNTDEFSSTFILSFAYDQSDEYTIPSGDNYQPGVAFEIATELKNPYDTDNRLTKGLEERRIPVALGHRRDKLSAVEHAVKALLLVADGAIKLFGGKTLGERIDEGMGRLMISHNSFAIPKLIVLQGDKIPANHRDILAAKPIYNKYHFTRSFKTAPALSQRRIYENIKIPFSFSDFMKTQKSSYFSTVSKRYCKFRELKWSISSDTAVATFEEAYQYVNPEALTETPIET